MWRKIHRHTPDRPPGCAITPSSARPLPRSKLSRDCTDCYGNAAVAPATISNSTGFVSGGFDFPVWGAHEPDWDEVVTEPVWEILVEADSETAFVNGEENLIHRLGGKRVLYRVHRVVLD